MKSAHYFKTIIIAFFTITVNATHANLRLPALIGNNMVLQQKEQILVWGWNDAGERVTVETSWNGKTYETTTKPDGFWQQIVSTPEAGGPYEIKISDRNFSILIRNVMIGEVWLCSGQSNMEFQMKDLGVYDAWKKMQNSKFEYYTNPNLRLFTVHRDTSETALSDCRGSWQMADTISIEMFSATAYFFGKNLCEALQVPIGLISAAWGGTPAETWIPLDRIKNTPELEKFLQAPNKAQWWSGYPGKTYNGMIKPIVNYKIKGVIWYQGESNVKDYKIYPLLMENLISAWRSDWNNPEMPFYFVQIAPFLYSNPVVGALLREAQAKCLAIPNTGMAVSLDLVDNIADIHPKNKWDIGKRLTLLALQKTYSVQNIVSEGPVLSNTIFKGNTAFLEFANVSNGLQINSNTTSNFLIAGKDRIFYPAKAVVNYNQIEVSSSKVQQPIAVRYAFENASTACLYNNQGLPSGTFRTDDWDIITEHSRLTPVFSAQARKVFYELATKERESDIYYALDETPDNQSFIYKTPIEIEKSGTLNARIARDGYFAQETSSWNISKHVALNTTIKYLKPYSYYYKASGEKALVDGILGSTNYNDGQWQGFEGDNIEIILDLGEIRTIQDIQYQFLKNYSSWIFLPESVKTEVSVDGVKFREVGNRSLTNNEKDLTPSIKTLVFEVKNKIRFIKLTAVNQKQCPAWHDYKGEKAWLFLDEIIVK